MDTGLQGHRPIVELDPYAHRHLLAHKICRFILESCHAEDKEDTPPRQINMTDASDTPILLIIFNRPDTTKRVLEAIRKARPKRLFIAADGPRVDRPDDAKRCDEARKIATAVDWPCQVETLFQDKNLGCKTAVSSGIDWFFSNVERGIILEDDCVPDHSFFDFCSAMLDRYKDDEKIMMVNGTNVSGTWDIPYSYLFSKFGSIWGWATWKRAWSHYDVTMKSWADPKNQKAVEKRLQNRNLWRDKKWSYDRYHAGKKDSWDYQWEYAMLVNSGVSIVPRVNLIENIGFSADSTHTKGSNGLGIKSDALYPPYEHGTDSDIDESYDRYFVKMVFKTKNILQKILAKLKRS